jgi:hypothetical protein
MTRLVSMRDALFLGAQLTGDNWANWRALLVAIGG